MEFGIWPVTEEDIKRARMTDLEPLVRHAAETLNLSPAQRASWVRTVRMKEHRPIASQKLDDWIRDKVEDWLLEHGFYGLHYEQERGYVWQLTVCDGSYDPTLAFHQSREHAALLALKAATDD